MGGSVSPYYPAPCASEQQSRREGRSDCERRRGRQGTSHSPRSPPKRLTLSFTSVTRCCGRHLDLDEAERPARSGRSPLQSVISSLQVVRHLPKTLGLHCVTRPRPRDRLPAAVALTTEARGAGGGQTPPAPHQRRARPLVAEREPTERPASAEVNIAVVGARGDIFKFETDEGHPRWALWIILRPRHRPSTPGAQAFVRAAPISATHPVSTLILHRADNWRRYAPYP
jgi:hypothetical protein